MEEINVQDIERKSWKNGRNFVSQTDREYVVTLRSTGEQIVIRTNDRGYAIWLACKQMQDRGHKTNLTTFRKDVASCRLKKE